MSNGWFDLARAGLPIFVIVVALAALSRLLRRRNTPGRPDVGELAAEVLGRRPAETGDR